MLISQVSREITSQILYVKQLPADSFHLPSPKSIQIFHVSACQLIIMITLLSHAMENAQRQITYRNDPTTKSYLQQSQRWLNCYVLNMRLDNDHRHWTRESARFPRKNTQCDSPPISICSSKSRNRRVVLVMVPRLLYIQ